MGVCEVSEREPRGQIRADQGRAAEEGEGERLAVDGVCDSESACLEGAVADGRARGEGGGGGRALQVRYAPRACVQQEEQR